MKTMNLKHSLSAALVGIVIGTSGVASAAPALPAVGTAPVVQETSLLTDILGAILGVGSNYDYPTPPPPPPPGPSPFGRRIDPPRPPRPPRQDIHRGGGPRPGIHHGGRGPSIRGPRPNPGGHRAPNMGGPRPQRRMATSFTPIALSNGMTAILPAM